MPDQSGLDHSHCPDAIASRAAAAFERDEVELRWQQYLEPPPARAQYMRNLFAFLVAASEEPRLRALFPHTSHQDLGFRRSVCGTANQALAWVRPFGEDRYLIAGPDRRQLFSAAGRTMRNEEPVAGALGPAPARESVVLVLAALDRDVPAGS